MSPNSRVPGLYVRHLSIALTALLCLTSVAFAGEPAEDRSAPNASHPHTPIVVRSKPVIERIPLAVIDPVDVRYSAEGYLYIADRRGGIVFRIRPTGRTEIIAEGLDGILRIAIAADESLYVLTGTPGSGRILQYLPNGESAEVGTVNFAPAGFGIDSTGTLLVSSAQSGIVEAIESDGTHRLFASLEGRSKDLLISSDEQPYVLLHSGQVVRLRADGSAENVGTTVTGASRLMQISPQETGVLHQHSTERPRISLLARRTSSPGASPDLVGDSPKSTDNPEVVLQVPNGTAAAAFDAMGNVVLVNPEIRAVTRVTKCLMVPCPHCGEKVPLIFSDEPDRTDKLGRERSF
ncbi:MAG: hypothetical protein ACK526_14465 [Planctomyces sp.]